MIAVFWKRATGYNIGVLSLCLDALLLILATMIVRGAAPLGPEPSQALQQGTAPTAAQRALLDQYCVSCHNQQLKTAGLMLDKADLNDIPGGAATWEKVVMK